MAITIVGKKPHIPPSPQQSDSVDGYTILDALKEFSEGKLKGTTLKLISRIDSAKSYVVLSFDPYTSRAKLELENSFKGGLLKPVITEREIPLYYPLWS